MMRAVFLELIGTTEEGYNLASDKNLSFFGFDFFSTPLNFIRTKTRKFKNLHLTICHMNKNYLPLAFFIVLTSAVIAAPIPQLKSYVTDNAGILSPETSAALESSLRSLEQQTNGVQFLVFIEKEIPKDSSLEEYSLKVAELNKVGKKGSDNGLLLFIAANDRAFRWEVGYGVESTLPASLLGRVSREYLILEFRKGNYGQGIMQSVDVVSRLLLKSEDADIVRLKEPGYKFVSPEKMMVIAIFFVLFFIFFIVFILRPITPKNKHDDGFYRGAAAGLFLGSLGRGRRGPGFGGFSGGFGGFSGGGGGFGGGGFSGRW